MGVLVDHMGKLVDDDFDDDDGSDFDDDDSEEYDDANVDDESSLMMLTTWRLIMMVHILS